MATTLNQLVYNIRNLASGGMTNRAHPYSDLQLEFWVKYYRNLLITRDIAKSGKVDQDLEQDFGCLTLTKADAAMCSRYCWGENVWYVCLPELLDLPNNGAITYFGLVNKQTRIPISEVNYGTYANFNRFVPRRTYGERIGSTIYLHNIDEAFPLEGVNARGVLEDPTQITACGVELVCFNKETDPYPISAHLVQPLTDLILSKEFGIARAMKVEKKVDDVVNQPL